MLSASKFPTRMTLDGRFEESTVNVLGALKPPEPFPSRTVTTLEPEVRSWPNTRSTFPS